MKAEKKIRTHKPQRWSGMGQKGVALAILVMVLGTLPACNSTQAHTHPGSSTKTVPTVTVEQPSEITSAPTSSPSPPPTATPNPTLLQLDFTETYSAGPCTGASVSETTCVTTTGTGYDAAHGSISLSRTSVYASPGAGFCSSATTQGTLTLATTSDTITFTGTGTFCRATQVADFTYTIAGGTGEYLRATGSGSIHVPLPNSSSSGTETWSGTLHTS
jgi:hypothetical protein